MWLLVVAAFGFLVPNGVFIHWVITGDKSVDAIFANELALAFIIDCVLAMVLLAWLFAVRPPGRVRWPWFVVLSLAGGLGFSIPLYLWLNWQQSGAPKASFHSWWRGAGVAVLFAVGIAASASAARPAELRCFTLDNEMALRSINHVDRAQAEIPSDAKKSAAWYLFSSSDRVETVYATAVEHYVDSRGGHVANESVPQHEVMSKD